MVGVRVVHTDYMPNAVRGAAKADGASPAPPTDAAYSWPARDVPATPQAPIQMKPLANWYWGEDEGRLSAHNTHDVYQPGNFVKYAGAVCAELEEHYTEYLAGTGPQKHQLNLVDRIASTGTETKAYAPDSGYDFEIDFVSMMQTNLRTGFQRKVMRLELPRDKPKVVPAANRQSTKSAKVACVSLPGISDTRIPTDLGNDDVLILHAGQIIQASKNRPDGWSYGSVIYDEVEDRAASAAEGISATTGWFPLNHTDLPNAAELEKLQSRMGGVDALAAPSYWQPVKDPLVAQMFEVAGAERQQAVDAFMTSLNASKVQIVKVERVETMSLWQSFAVKRQTVLQREKDKSASTRLERVWLFHGTTEDIVPKITQQGFNRSFCGRNATMYGKGVYFARDSSYSASKAYSAPDASGVQRIFLCRVVVGEYCQGRKDAVAPDVRAGHTLYDTTVDNMRQPGIFVTYHDAQAYPEYLIHFKQ